MTDSTNPTPKPFAGTCPMTPEAVVDRYFMEHRGRLLEIAAFLDRIDRGRTATGLPSMEPTTAPTDPRVTALLKAAAILNDGQPDRARRIQLALSDPTTEPIAEAHTKAACGAYVPNAD